jgi:uncharacterized protein YjbI with pentapeptide repeats
VARVEHANHLARGVEHWNRWRKDHPGVVPDLTHIQMCGEDLRGTNLRDADLEDADLSETRLGVNSERSSSRETRLSNTYVGKLLAREDGRPADLRGANLASANLIGANLRWVAMDDACLLEAAVCGAKLGHAGLDGADLRGSRLDTHSHYGRTELCSADINGANLMDADLRGVDARNSRWRDARLGRADLRDADLTDADLRRSHLVETQLDGAILRGAQVYGVAAWDVSVSDETLQNDLVIARSSDDPRITVDDIRVAQFIYLLLDNRNIRTVIDTIGRKGVLLLGRFSPERKMVLEELRDELRERGYLPIVFDFERATTRDITETIMVLAGLSLFIIADITNPRSSPLELQATVPNYMTPVVPIIERDERPFAMFDDLLTKNDWVLEPLTYDTPQTLRAVFLPAILEPALRVHELMVEKRRARPGTRDVRDYVDQAHADS